MDSSSFLRFGPLLGASLLIVGLIEAKRSVEEAPRKSAAQVERSEAYLAEAQKLSRSGSWASEADSLEPTYWSAEMFRIVGLPLADDPPAVEEFAALFPPEDWTRLMEMFKAAPQENDVGWRHSFDLTGRNDADERVRGADGAYRWFHYKGVCRCATRKAVLSAGVFS
jgi:hypothetical protein